MTVMGEPIRHMRRRDPSIWPTLVAILAGCVVVMCVFAVILEVIR